MTTARPEGERFQEEGVTRVSLGGGRSIPEEHYGWWRDPSGTPSTTTSPALPNPLYPPVRAHWQWRHLVGAVVVVALAVLLAVVTSWQGRHEVTTAPDPVAAAAAAVTWSHYQPGYREELAADSCADLDTAYRAAELVDGPVDSRPVEAYIVALAGAKGCTP